MKLEHASAYLPHGLKVYDIGTNKLFSTPLNLNTIEYLIENITSDSILKLALRPLSDLTKEIEHNGEKFVPIKVLGINKNWLGINEYLLHVNNQPYSDIKKLLEWHFDIFGLIESGQAIDINTLNK